LLHCTIRIGIALDIHFITEKINKALSAAGLMRMPGTPAAGEGDLEVLERVDTVAPGAPAAAPTERQPAPQPSARPAARPTPAPAGRFTALSYRARHGARDYKLYVPAGRAGQPLPLLLMLHGCKQNPDDFAAGTRMNELAEQHGFLVAYPAQAAAANGSNCWNWFERKQQSRDGAEPQILAGIVGEIVAHQRVQSDRVYVAGLSAGAAMAVILGRTHPELFAGVAAHSGLPLGAAHDVASAFAAMAGRAAPGPAGGDAAWAGNSPTPRTIVFHGEADTTVKASNGAAITRQAVAAFEAGTGPLRVDEREAPSAAGSGRRAQVSRWLDEGGVAQVEAWRIEGAGHAWSGGDSAGSYTDPAGPDASAEIVRFFMAH
jgi:poly(hydroxyalkanoate) depolymerase family esterase